MGLGVLEVIETCRRVTGQPIEYRVEDRRTGDPSILVGDARLVGGVLGWVPVWKELDGMIETAWQSVCQTKNFTK